MSTTVVSAKQTWRKIKRKVIKPTVKRLDVELENLRIAEFEAYRSWLVSHLNQLSLNGFVREPIDTYFVPPHLTYRKGPMLPRQKIPRKLRSGRHTLNEFLQAARIHKHKLLVLGEPGMGKTTLLRSVAKQMAEEGLNDPTVRLPILLVARPLADSLIQRPGKNLSQLIHEQLQAAGLETDKNWITEQLLNGRCLLMFDGLDEIIDPEAWELFIKWVNKQIANHKKNVFLVTTRPFIGNSDTLEDWTTLTLEPFNNDQLKRFMKLWSVTRRQEWMEQLKRPFLQHVASNPYLLTLLRLTEQPMASTELGLLGQLLTQRLTDSYEADSAAQMLESQLRRFMLAEVAYEMTKARDIYLSDEALSHTVGAAADWVFTSGIMVQTATGMARFSHLLLQAYLTAVHVRAHGLEEELWEKLDDRWWHDTIRLFAQDQSPEQLIAHGLTATEPTVERLHLVHTTLANSQDLPPKLVESVPRLLWHHSSDAGTLQQRLIAELMLAVRFSRADGQTAASGLLVNHAEYQLFVDDMQAHGRFTQPDHWLAYHFPKGQATRPIVGTRPADAESFCDWLNERQVDPHAIRYRLPRPSELNGYLYTQIGNQTGVAYWVHNGDNTSLEVLTPPNSATDIIQRQLSRDLCRAYPHAHGAGFRFQETIPLILDPSRAAQLNIPTLLLPEFDPMLVDSLSILENYERLNEIGSQLETEEDWAHARAQIATYRYRLADVLAEILQIAPQQIQEFITNLPRTITLAKQRNLEPLPILARQFVRFYALILAASLQSVWLLQRQFLASPIDIMYRDKVETWHKKVSDNVAIYLDIYTDMVILDERKAGNLQATEGICLVGDPALSRGSE
ncbi:MAG: NACHT domain-containing protein [Chloroflexota bacterium]